MIRNESEYQEALRRKAQDQDVAAGQRTAFVNAGFTPEEVERGLEPLLSFQAQLADEVIWYEKVCRREFAPVSNLAQVGRLLIALRVAGRLTQRELAERLGVSEAQISRDERNEYHGITLERAQRILDALRARIEVRLEEPVLITHSRHP